MAVRRRDVLKLILSGAAAGTLASRRAEATQGAAIRRDVAIIGGGSAGTFAALRLRDQGKSVVVLERTERLGGHAETYRDAATGMHSDIGVIVFPDIPLVREYFGRFGVQLVTSRGGGGGTSVNVDFRTGKPVDAYAPTQAEFGAALQQYLGLLATRYSFIDQNGYQLPPPGPILEEVLQPFATWCQNNGLTALLPTFYRFEQGFGSLFETPAFYVLKNMNTQTISGLLRGFVTTVDGIGRLYEAATDELQEDVVFDAQVRLVDRRSNGGIRLLVQTGEGLRVVHCKKLIVTAPPVVTNFLGFDLDAHEVTTFLRFNPNHYLTGVVKIAGLAPGTSLNNAAPDTPFNLAPVPGIYGVGPTSAPGLYNVKYGSTFPIPHAFVRAAIKADIERVRVPGVGPLQFQGFATFKDHSPYALMVRRDDVRAGFYRTLEGLQGRNDTFYAGAAFQTHSSANIWAYIDALLPRLFA